MAFTNNKFLHKAPLRHIKCGIVGLPNSGKSSLYNLLTHSNTPVSTSLYTTTDICCHAGEVDDDRMVKISEIYDNRRISQSFVTYFDTCGIERDSHLDKGMGIDFLENYCEMDILLHIVRVFPDDNITHVEETIDPIRDIAIVNKEIVEKTCQDIEFVSFLLASKEMVISRNKCLPEDKYEYEVLKRIYEVLSGSEFVPPSKRPSKNGSKKKVEVATTGTPLRFVDWDRSERQILNKYHFLSCKELVYVLNYSMRDYLRTSTLWDASIQTFISQTDKARFIKFSVQFEQHRLQVIAQSEIRPESYDVANSSHVSSLQSVYDMLTLQLDLIRVYTVGDAEIKVWSVRQGTSAVEVAGFIHTDMERGFVCVDAMTFDDLVEMGSEANVRRVGKLRQQGKNYLVNDGDILFFKWNK